MPTTTPLPMRLARPARSSLTTAGAASSVRGAVASCRSRIAQGTGPPSDVKSWMGERPEWDGMEGCWFLGMWKSGNSWRAEARGFQCSKGVPLPCWHLWDPRAAPGPLRSHDPWRSQPQRHVGAKEDAWLDQTDPLSSHQGRFLDGADVPLYGVNSPGSIWDITCGIWIYIYMWYLKYK